MSPPSMQGFNAVAERAARRYRRLLRLLPGDFRGRHGAAMEDAFVEMHRRAASLGMAAVIMLWLREGWDLARTGISLRTAARHRSADAIARGMPPASRRRLAILGGLRDDLALALRSTTRNRGFFLLAAMTLALGVGATTAMYSALKAVVLEPFPFPWTDRLVTLNQTMGTKGQIFLGLDADDVPVLRSQRDVFTAIEGVWSGAATITDFEEPERVSTLRMTKGLPALIGVQPLSGRVFTDDELAGDGQRVVLLSHALWRRRFGGRPDVLGRTLRFDGEAWTIIGVMPRDAVRPSSDPRPVDLWLPLPDDEKFRTSVARLADGVALETAAARVDAVVRGKSKGNRGGTVRPLVRPEPLHDHLRVLMGAVMVLLLVACVNVSNLLLQRASVRARETAVRAAIGATRGRLLRQFMLESAILGIAGGIVGAALAWGSLTALLALRPEKLSALQKAHIDASILAFSIGVAIAASILFGVLPAFHGSRAAATAALGRLGRDGDGRFSGFRLMLVAAEVALSFALLVGAAVTIDSLRALAARDPGYRAEGLVSVEVQLPEWRYDNDAARRAAFERMVEDVRRIPAVQTVVLADGVPPTIGGARFGKVHVEGGTPESEVSIFESFQADSGFFETLGMSVISGRGFTAADRGSPLNPVILSESAARRLFPRELAIGRRFGLEGPDRFTVVGIARDIRATGLNDDGTAPLLYWPLDHVRERMHLVVRTGREDPQILLDLRQMVRRSEPSALISVATGREMLGATLAMERFTTSLLSTFAVLALLLAAIGLYGVLSQVVVSRTREIGVRMALGADAARIRRLVLRTGVLATFAGLVIGAGLAAGGHRVLRSQLFGLTDARPGVYVIATLVLLAVSMAAMLVPASRAARLDPMRVIRAE